MSRKKSYFGPRIAVCEVWLQMWVKYDVIHYLKLARKKEAIDQLLNNQNINNYAEYAEYAEYACVHVSKKQRCFWTEFFLGQKTPVKSAYLQSHLRKNDASLMEGRSSKINVHKCMAASLPKPAQVKTQLAIVMSVLAVAGRRTKW